MSKMKEVANILGVEIGKVFRATGINEDFRITDSRFERLTICKEWVEAPADMLYKLLKGEWKVVKKPFKPKDGEQYWYGICCGAVSKDWQGGMLDLAYYAIGNCFRTEEEAEKHKDEVLAKLEEVYDSGKPLIRADEWRDKE